MNAKKSLEFFKQCGIWTYRSVEMFLELLGYLIFIAYEFWVITVIVVFILIAWYFEIIKF